MSIFIIYASVTFALVIVRFICLRFSLRFFGVVGGYKLRRMCLHCLRSPYDHLTISFGDKLGLNLTETLRISYDNRKIIIQPSCNFTTSLYKSHDARTVTLLTLVMVLLSLIIQRHYTASSLEAKMKSLHANNKGTHQTALSSTQPGQHIRHSFSAKYIL